MREKNVDNEGDMQPSIEHGMMTMRTNGNDIFICI
jgi:hypothetical protein